MCRLFGFRSAVPSGAHRSLVEAQNALVRQSSRHPDGWGIGWIHGEDAYVVKTAAAAFDSERFRKVSESLRSQTFVAHVRKATVGQLDPLNAHPFRHGRWLFAHNGTLFEEGEGLRSWLHDRTDPVLRTLIHGDTDSEVFFYHLLTQLGRAGIDVDGRRVPNPRIVARTVRQTVAAMDEAAIDRGMQRPWANLILTEGRVFVAHRAGIPLYLSTQKRHCPEAETCPAVKVCLETLRPHEHPVNHAIVASEAIAPDENRWEEIADGATVVLDAGFRLVVLAPEQGWTAPRREVA